MTRYRSPIDLVALYVVGSEQIGCEIPETDDQGRFHRGNKCCKELIKFERSYNMLWETVALTFLLHYTVAVIRKPKAPDAES